MLLPGSGIEEPEPETYRKASLRRARGWFSRSSVAMKAPNADRAVIAAEQLTGYVLNVSHERGGPKARLLLSVGYRSNNPQLLESDLRVQHLSLDVTRTHQSAYGVVYEIEGPITTPNGRAVASARSGRLTLVSTCRDSLPCTRGSNALRHVRRRDPDPRRH